MQEKILESFNQTTVQLLQTISAFSQDEFNKLPFEGSWTAAQFADHLYKSEKGITKLLTGNSVKTTRAADEKLKMIETAFLDFTTKLKSPESILPTRELQNVMTVHNLLLKNREAISELINTVDLHKTFTGATLPGLGELTGIEWISFLMAHCKRHVFQLNNIFERLN